jgi:hypothetical protein
MLSVLSEYQGIDGISAAVRHIEVAERYLTRGRDERDDDAFNDVIYRTNQAFEGMLKEAYRVLTGSDTAKLSPHQIEQRLLEAKILSQRVNLAVARYRQEWRNPSAHDHTLLFTEQDALLAIVSVSAFAAVLLNQMIEARSFQRKKAAVEAQKSAVTAALADYASLDFEKSLIALLQAFAGGMQTGDADLHGATEAEIRGELGGYLAAADPAFRISLEMQIGSREFDILVERGSERAAIELRRGGTTQFLRAVANQVASVVADAQLDFGLVFVPPRAPTDLVRVTRVHAIRHGVKVIIVAPRDEEASDSE